MADWQFSAPLIMSEYMTLQDLSGQQQLMVRQLPHSTACFDMCHVI